MSTRWVVGILLLWFTVTLVSLILDAQYLGAEETSNLNTLMHPEFLEGASIPFIGFFIVAWSWIRVLFDAITFNYSFLTGTWAILKYVGWCLSIATIAGFVLALRGAT